MKGYLAKGFESEGGQPDQPAAARVTDESNCWSPITTSMSDIGQSTVILTLRY